MLKNSAFKSEYNYFHLNFEFQTFPHFKALDWLFINHQLRKSLSTWTNLELHCLVMMDSHIHLLFRIAENQENFFVSDLLSKLDSKKTDINASLVEPITHVSQYLNTYKYIYQNPLKAGLCDKCENYIYSSLHEIISGTQNLPYVDTLNSLQNPYKVLNWLNADSLFKSSKLSQTFQENSFFK